MTFWTTIPGILILMVPMIVTVLAGCDEYYLEQLAADFEETLTQEQIEEIAGHYNCVTDESGVTCTLKETP